MANYPVNKIRNVCLMGHGGDGKTSLVESLLNIAGVTDRVGKIADGNTVCDFDPEEIKRKFSISTAVAPVEWNGCKINLLDTPGFFDFESEVQCVLRVAESALIVATGKSGPGVGTEKAWAHCEEHAMPRMFYISKIDEENSDYYNSLHKLQKQFGVSVAPIVVPIFEGNRDTVGIVDCVIRKAYRMEGNKRVEIPIPDNMKDRIDQHRAALCENIAELSEDLMERYFAGEEFSDEELIAGIRQGVKDLVLAPVFCGTAATGIGSYALLKGIADYMPSPDEKPVEICEDEKGELIEINCTPNGSTCAFVFKTVADQYGRFSYFKVMSGEVKQDMTLVNKRADANEKMGHIFTVCGKKTTEVPVIGCGDIGAVSKLVTTKTGDTLSMSVRKVELEPIEIAPPCYTQAIAPKVGVGDVLIGATALAGDMAGSSKASHVKDKLIEMTHLNETLYCCGIACSSQGTKTKAGNYLIDLLLANVCKQNVTRFPYEIARLAQDLAGGLMVTQPSEADYRNPELKPYIEKYLKGVASVPTEDRMRLLRLIENMTMGTAAVGYLPESMHGAGSPQAQRIMIARQSNLEMKKELAKKIARIK